MCNQMCVRGHSYVQSNVCEGHSYVQSNVGAVSNDNHQQYEITLYLLNRQDGEESFLHAWHLIPWHLMCSKSSKDYELVIKHNLQLYLL